MKDKVVTWSTTQSRLWIRYKELKRSIPEALADMHACISCAHSLLPPKGVKTPGSSHKRTYFEYVADAVVIGLCILSKYGQDIDDFPEESDGDDKDLLTHTLDMHRLLSGAYMQVRDQRPDDLFYWQIANLVEFSIKIASRHRKNLLQMVRERHLQ